MKVKKLIALFASTTSLALAVGLFSDNNFSTEQYASATTQTAEDQAKAVVQNKLWNAIDNYKTVKGTYESISKRGGNTSVEFQVREGEKPSSYHKVTTADGRVLETRMNGSHLISKVNGQIAMNSRVAPERATGQEKHMNRYEAKGQEKSRVYRTDPAFAVSGDVTFPQGIGFWLEDYSKWSILEEPSMLGRTVAVVSGELPSSIKEKHQAETFTLWMDKATGILLKLQEYNAQGEVVEGHEVTSIKINGGVDEGAFRIAQEEIDKGKR